MEENQVQGDAGNEAGQADQQSAINLDEFLSFPVIEGADEKVVAAIIKEDRGYDSTTVFTTPEERKAFQHFVRKDVEERLKEYKDTPEVRTRLKEMVVARRAALMKMIAEMKEGLALLERDMNFGTDIAPEAVNLLQFSSADWNQLANAVHSMFGRSLLQGFVEDLKANNAQGPAEHDLWTDELAARVRAHQEQQEKLKAMLEGLLAQRQEPRANPI